MPGFDPFRYRFPYTNINSINLDWIIKKVRKLSEDVAAVDPERMEEVAQQAAAAEQAAQSALETAESVSGIATDAETIARAAQATANSAADSAQAAETAASVAGQSAQSALEKLQTRPRVNMLDNAYFVGGGSQLGGDAFPINQRGQTIYNNPGYCIDRWKLDSGSVEVRANGLYLNGTLSQVLPCDIGVLYTAGYLSNGRIYTASYNSGNRTFTISANGALIKAAYLEIGSGVTLAYPFGTEAVNQYFPNFEEELAKCQRYYLHGVGYASVGFLADTGSAYVNIITPVTMARVPTMTIVQYNNLIHGTTLEPIIRANVSELRKNAVSVEVGIGTTGVFELCMTADFKVNLSADL